MKTFKIILSPILTFIFTCILLQYSYSQSLEVEENFNNNSFTAKKLTKFQLSGFEKRASQKITDFANYIQIISDKSYDLSLRKHALKLTIDLFINENISIKLNNKNISKENPTKLSKFLKAVLESDYSKITVDISDIQILENLNSDKKGDYKGKLIYTETFKYYKNNRLISTYKQKRETDINLIKIDKNFGTSQTKVRSILLGNIN